MPYLSDPLDSFQPTIDRYTAQSPIADQQTKSHSRWKDQPISPIHPSFPPHPLLPISTHSKLLQLDRQPHPPGKDIYHLPTLTSLNSSYLFPLLNPISNGPQTLPHQTPHLNLLLFYYIQVNLYLIYRG
jgi:hypothetical protein